MPADILLNFENTQKSFAYKTDAELKKAKWLFTAMQYNWLVNMGTSIMPWAIKTGLPIKSIIKQTLFKQFVGGETLEQTDVVMKTLENFGVRIILDYGVEGGEYTEEKYDTETAYFIKVIQYAGSRLSIPFISIKLTGLCSFYILEKLDLKTNTHSLEKKNELIQHKISQLSHIDRKKWDNLIIRTTQLCAAAKASNIGIMVDAEESWIQDAIDHVTEEMMRVHNTEKPVVFNTVQLYRHDKLAYIKALQANATTQGYLLGLKLVRGAYMEKERKRADDMKYSSPIQADKISTDRDYDEAVSYCIDRISTISIVVASHNEKSNKLAASLALNKGIKSNDKHLHFSQLYGMSDNLTFNLADANFNVSKYLPFGPVQEVIPYLMRRAQENSAVAGQTSRELQLINKECRRRGL
jgi:proline dehydrogenase